MKKLLKKFELKILKLTKVTVASMITEVIPYIDMCIYIYIYIYVYTRSFGRYAPILLAPAEGWGPFGPPRALQALLGAEGPQ